MKFILGIRQFTLVLTLALGSSAPSAWAQVTTLAATGLSTNSGSATLNASINPGGHATGVYFEWGTTTAYGTTTAPLSAGAGNGTAEVSATIIGLMSRTNYHFRAVATNSAGTNFGNDLTFSTPFYPGRLSQPAIVGGDLQATVSGTSNALYGIYASTNLINWLLLPPGQITLLSSHPFQVDLGAVTNVGQWFYLLR